MSLQSPAHRWSVTHRLGVLGILRILVLDPVMKMDAHSEGFGLWSRPRKMEGGRWDGQQSFLGWRERESDNKKRNKEARETKTLVEFISSLEPVCVCVWTLCPANSPSFWVYTIVKTCFSFNFYVKLVIYIHFCEGSHWPTHYSTVTTRLLNKTKTEPHFATKIHVLPEIKWHFLVLCRGTPAGLLAFFSWHASWRLTQLGRDKPPDILPFPPPSLSRLISLFASQFSLCFSLSLTLLSTQPKSRFSSMALLLAQHEHTVKVCSYHSAATGLWQNNQNFFTASTCRV